MPEIILTERQEKCVEAIIAGIKNELSYYYFNGRQSGKTTIMNEVVRRLNEEKAI